MRKRKYGHLDAGTYKSDNLIEDVLSLGEGGPAAGDASDMPQAAVHNLVGTARLLSSSMPLDLKQVSRLIPNMQYDRQKFAAITVRLCEPFCTVLLFTSGKMVLTGCKNFVQCVLAATQILEMMEMGFGHHKFDMVDVRIQNIVGNVDVRLRDGEGVALDLLLEENRVYSTYLPNMFPGLIYRPVNSPVVLLLFKSGKIVITGGRSCQDIYDGWAQLWPFVKKYIRR